MWVAPCSEQLTGGKAVNALSTKMIVSTAREGIKEIVEFSKGQFISSKTENSQETGVEVLFYPDPAIFETVAFDSAKLQNMIQEFSFLCTGLKFIFIDEKNNIEKTFLSEHGLYDYIQYLAKDKELLIDPIYFYGRDGFFQVEAALAYTKDYGNIIRLYTNNIPQEKGTHLTGFKSALTTTFNVFAREQKWLKEKDVNFSGSDLEEGQILILNFKMIDPVFKGQNKEELSSSEGRTYVQRISSLELKDYFNSHTEEIKAIADKAINARKAREAAKKARDAVRNVDGKNKKQKLFNLPTKLVDANSKNRAECELLITEGDSAATGLIAGRNSETQAIFPIRGKIISAFKAPKEKLFANQEVVNIIKALGLDMDNNGRLIYDERKLRYGRIIPAVDADFDGQAIKNLLITLFWRLCPELIIRGHIYIVIPPLFRITTSKNEYIYLKNIKALEEYKEKHQGEKFLINRNKGLGEQDTEELSESLLDAETRNILQLTVNDVKTAENLLETLMGTNVPPRRKWLLEHSEEARGEFDIYD